MKGAAVFTPDAHGCTACFSCGQGMVYRGSRFCQAACQAWFDAGNPPYDRQADRNWQKRDIFAVKRWRLVD